ncbi:MAG: hypothetical protein K8R35_05015, partial [Bacteroidales bacterium]|nr:hypothetical protein [Bacteroidales bacterium]
DVVMKHCDLLIGADDRNTDVYLVMSKIRVVLLDYPSVINVISRNILVEPDKYDLYFSMGTYYQEFNQHSIAINDFSKAIALNNSNPDLYFKRAHSY